MKKRLDSTFDLLATALLYLIIGGFVRLLFYADKSYVLATLPALAITLYFYSRERIFKAHMPGAVRFVVLLVMAMHMYGYVLRLYVLFDPWDKIEHLIGGGVIGALAAMTALTLAAREKFTIRKGSIVFLAFIFALGIGAIWEIIEFTIDQMRAFNFAGLSGHTPLQWGNTDTMLDMIFNGTGGLIAGLLTLLLVDFKAYMVKPHPFFDQFLERRKSG